MGVRVEFCGEVYVAREERPLTIGRTGDVQLDDNPYLHRSFLTVSHEGGLWWLTNVGTTLSATIADPEGRLQAWLSPGARVPLALDRFTVWFTAGPTTYDFDVVVDDPAFVSTSAHPVPAAEGGRTTVGRVSMTPDQQLLLVALCEDFLRRTSAGQGEIPSSAAAAARLGWTVTRFNRKLDNVCQKLATSGVRGLHGGPGNLATGRKARLVEHALSVRMVTEADLALLPAVAETPSESTV